MKKQLEKDEKKQEVPSASKEKSEVQFYSTPQITAFTLSDINISHHTTYLATYPDSPSAAIFHPPSFC